MRTTAALRRISSVSTHSCLPTLSSSCSPGDEDSVLGGDCPMEDSCAGGGALGNVPSSLSESSPSSLPDAGLENASAASMLERSSSCSVLLTASAWELILNVENVEPIAPVTSRRCVLGSYCRPSGSSSPWRRRPPENVTSFPSSLVI